MTVQCIDSRKACSLRNVWRMVMTCRAIEEMLKAVEKQTILRNIRVLQTAMGLSYEQLFDVLEIPEADRQRYLDMLTSTDK